MSNPFILSSIPANPEEVVRTIQSMVNNPTFRMKVVANGGFDPIASALDINVSIPTSTSAPNQYQVDESNIDLIISRLPSGSTVERSYIKNVYLLNNRNVNSTLAMLGCNESVQ